MSLKQDIRAAKNGNIQPLIDRAKEGRFLKEQIDQKIDELYDEYHYSEWDGDRMREWLEELLEEVNDD